MRPEPSTPSAGVRATAARVRFAQFEVDLRARELYRRGERIPLQDRPFEVLAALLERPGEVVLRQELQERLWPGQIVEFDNNLNTALTKLRRALDDATGEARLIETLPKRGYRLLAPVEVVGEETSGPEAVGGTSPDRGVWRPVLFLTIAAALAVATFLVLRADRGAPPEASDAADSVAVAPVRSSLLVVLPFTGLGAAAADTALADAVTEELIGRLAELLPPEIGVIARTSAMRFRAAASVADVREALGVDYVLEGSVARAGGEIRVHARFIHAGDQAHLWAETHEAPIDELPRVQHVIAERIATSVSGQLRTGATPAAGKSVPPAAWESYLQARYLLSARLDPSSEEIATAVELLEEVVAGAPDFALAWSALADAVPRLAGPAPEINARSRRAAERALALDPGLARPRHRLASLALYQEWDWGEAERQFDWALSLAPNLALNHHSRAAWFATQGRHEEALESIDRALRLDPLSVVLHADAGWYLFVARRYEEAILRCREALELVPEHRGANSYLLHSQLALGRVEEAAETARRLLVIEGAPDDLVARATGSSEAAVEALRRHRLVVLEADYAQGRASPGRLAVAHLDLGDEDTALALLEEGLESRWGWIYPFLAVYPLLDPLADEPRFQRLVDAVGIPIDRAEATATS